MIVSHRHRFIFHQAMRCASSTMEVALATECGPGDVITHIHEQEGLPPDYRHPARNFDGYWNHLPPWMIRERVGETTWESYFKVSSVRNPWARMASIYWWLQHRQLWKALAPPYDQFDRGDCNLTFKSWLLDLETAFEEDTWSGEHLWMDFYLRFEHLHQDYMLLCNLLGFQPRPTLPHAKPGSGRPYAPLYTPGMRQRVSELFPLTIRNWGYRFGE